MSDVFVSHVAEDAAVALEIAVGLERAGFSTWCYEVDSLLGQTYLRETREAVAAAQAVLVLVSPRSLGAPQMTIEIVRALETGRPLIPVLLETGYEMLQQRSPDWAQAFGASTARAFERNAVGPLVEQLLTTLPRLGVQGRPPDPRHTQLLEQTRTACSRSRPTAVAPWDQSSTGADDPDPLPPRRPWSRRTADRIARSVYGFDATSGLILLLFPVWVMALIGYVYQARHGGLAWVGVVVRAPASRAEFPIVRSTWPDPKAASAGLKRDREALLEMDGRSLAGVGPLRFMAMALERRRQIPSGAQVTMRVRRTDGSERETALPFVPIKYPWRIPLVGASFAIVAVLLLLRRADAPLPRATCLGMITFGIHWTWFFGGPHTITYVWAGLFALSSTFFMPLLLRAIAHLPEELPLPSRMPRWPWSFALFGPVVTSYVWGEPFPPTIGVWGMYAINAIFLAVVLVEFTRRYRRASPRGRLQLRWILYGLYVGLVPVTAANIAVSIGHEGRWVWLFDATMASVALFPLCVLVAIMRSNLLDIDRLIATTTLFYGLVVCIAIPVIVLVPRVASAASAFVNVAELPAWVGDAAGALLLVACAAAAWQGLPYLDRIFRPERARFTVAADGILEMLEKTHDTDALLVGLGHRLRDILKLDRCSVYVRKHGAFVARLTHAPRRARAVPEHIPVRSPIVAVVKRYDGPIDLQGAWGTRRAYRLDPVERDVLAPLESEVILPIRRSRMIEAFVALGAKHSLDVYTPTDVAQLARIAERASARLLHVSLERIASPSVVEAIEVKPQLVRPMHVELSVMAVAQSSGQVSPVVLRHGGVANEQGSETTLGFWNAPVPQSDHARRACEAALELTSAEPAVSIAIATGIGVVELAEGETMRLVARGDVVDLARGLERLNIRYGTRAIIADATRDRVPQEFICREIDCVRLGHRDRPIVIHELLGVSSEDRDGRFRRLRDLFARGVAAYRARDFAGAIDSFERVAREHPNDRATQLYLQRCRMLRQDPPDAAWNGVVELDV